MEEGMRNDETRKVWILHLTIFNVPRQWESVFKAVNSVTLLTYYQALALLLQNLSWRIFHRDFMGQA